MLGANRKKEQCKRYEYTISLTYLSGSCIPYSAISKGRQGKRASWGRGKLVPSRSARTGRREGKGKGRKAREME